MNKIKIGKSSKVTIDWNVLPINYSKEIEKNIITRFSQKYDIPKENVKVEPNFIKIDSKGVKTALTNEMVNNIRDPKFQHQLFQSYINANNIEDYDFQALVDIDNKVNNAIDYTLYDKYCKYNIKWLKWNNFLSYGDDNFVDFTKLNGLVLLKGEPANQSGKTTFAYDLLHFLLFGKTSSGKADVLSKMFNIYRPEETQVFVEGGIEINGEDYIVRRTLQRPSLTKRSDKSKITQKVQYFKVNGDIEEELIDIDNEEGSSNTQTNLIIKESIGNERDFDLVICANSDNLKSLISLKETERGKILSKWIGLIILEEKDAIAKDIFNKQINPSLLSNKYNRDDLKLNVETLKSENVDHVKSIDVNSSKLIESDKKIGEDAKMIETLLVSKRKINHELSTIDVATITKQQQTIISDGKRKRGEKDVNDKRLIEIANVVFNEDEYKTLLLEEKTLSIKINNLKRDISDLEKENVSLKNSEVCPTCKRKLDNVDYSNTIKENNDKITQLKKVLDTATNELKIKNDNITKMEGDRLIFNEKNRLSIIIEKNIVDLDIITKNYKETVRILNELSENKESIEINNNIDLNIRNIKISLEKETTYNKSLIALIEKTKQIIKSNEKQISDNIEIINKINSEDKIIRDWKLYLQLIGKNGISKVVLKTTLPLINGELQRLLNDVVDFTVEVDMNNKNDVVFNLVRDGISNNLSSGSGFEETAAALALRVVLGNISTMPRPNFIVFDEVLGGVAKENYDKMKLLYDRIVKNYSFIFQITHIDDIADWHNQILTVKRNGRISELNLKTI